LVTLSPLWE